MQPHEVVVLQHVACEPPGSFEAALARRGELRAIELDEEGSAPLVTLGTASVAAVVAMGGPMGAYETERFPWLVEEQAFLGEAVAAGVPVLGVCLGAQLLARALGGRVRPGQAPEVGVAEVALTEAGRQDPVLGNLPERFEVLHFHGDTFTLPEGAVHLAASSTYRNQAFRVGPAYGLQFHLEAPPSLVATWLKVPEYRNSARNALGPSGPTKVVADLERAAGAMAAAAETVIERWLATFVDPRLA